MTCVAKQGTSSFTLLILSLFLSLLDSSPVDTSTVESSPHDGQEVALSQEVASSQDCQNKPKGCDYRGEVSTTGTGKKCRPWAQVQ